MSLADARPTLATVQPKRERRTSGTMLALALLSLLTSSHQADGMLQHSHVPLADVGKRETRFLVSHRRGQDHGAERGLAYRAASTVSKGSRQLLSSHQENCSEEVGARGNTAQVGGIAVPDPMYFGHVPTAPAETTDYYHYDSYNYYDYYGDMDEPQGEEDKNTDPWGDQSAARTETAATRMPGMGPMSTKQQGELCPSIGYTFPRGVIMSARQADSTLQCHERCLSERACVSWSWVDPHRAVNRDDLGICYLKYECDLSTLAFMDNGVWDGWPGCQVRDSKVAMDVLQGWVCPGLGYEFVGGTYNTFRASSACSCQALCIEQHQCLAWSWYADADSLCNLKNGFFSLQEAPKREIHAGTRNCTW